MKTVAEQIAAMRTEHPGFQLRYEDARAAIWRGRLAPTAQRSYLVEVTYKTPIMGEMFTISQIQPRVRVLDPRLEKHPDYEEGPTPHVYWDQEALDYPVLCLFSLEGKEWGLDDLIAETTIYWAARWLYFYEGWLATKMWKGGGRHPGHPAEAKPLETV